MSSNKPNTKGDYLEELDTTVTAETPPAEATPPDPDTLKEIEAFQQQAFGLADAFEVVRTRLIEAELLQDHIGIDLTALCAMIGRRMAIAVPDPNAENEDSVGQFLESCETEILNSYDRFLQVAEQSTEEVPQDAS